MYPLKQVLLAENLDELFKNNILWLKWSQSTGKLNRKIVIDFLLCVCQFKWIINIKTTILFLQEWRSSKSCRFMEQDFQRHGGDWDVGWGAEVDLLHPGRHLPLGCSGRSEGTEQQATVCAARRGPEGLTADRNHSRGACQADLCLRGILNPQ